MSYTEFFRLYKNEAFFKLFTLKYRRLYYDCIQILIEKTKELPVLYESDAKDSITVYMKNKGINETKKNLSDAQSDEETEEDESGTDLQPGAMKKVGDCTKIINQRYVGYKSFEKNKRMKNERT